MPVAAEERICMYSGARVIVWCLRGQALMVSLKLAVHTYSHNKRRSSTSASLRLVEHWRTQNIPVPAGCLLSHTAARKQHQAEKLTHSLTACTNRDTIYQGQGMPQLEQQQLRIIQDELLCRRQLKKIHGCIHHTHF